MIMVLTPMMPAMIVTVIIQFIVMQIQNYVILIMNVQQIIVMNAVNAVEIIQIPV